MPEQQHRILAAGDSFIGIFRLFRREANFDIQKFKGATAKGLTKPLNENRLKLIELCDDPSNKYTCGIFNFGQVDVHHSFYYNVVGEKVDMKAYLEYYDTLASNYVDFIASLDIPLKIITAVYPSPLVTSEVPRELMTYNVLGPEDVITYSPEDWWTISCRSARHSRLVLFNNALEVACAKHANVKYISVNSSILNGDNTVRSTFKDINPVNLHLLWEPLILLWAEELSSLGLGISSKMLVDMHKSASAYNIRKIQELGDRVFAIGPNLQLIMDYLDSQALLFNEVCEAPIVTEKATSTTDSGLASPASATKTRREKVQEITYSDWRRQPSNSNSTENTTNSGSSSSSSSSSQDNYSGGSRSGSNYYHEGQSRSRENNDDRMRGRGEGHATRHDSNTYSRPGQDEGRDRDRDRERDRGWDGRASSDAQSRPQTGRTLSDILEGRRGSHQSAYSHSSAGSSVRSSEYDSGHRAGAGNPAERSRSYPSTQPQSSPSPYYKGPNQGSRGLGQGQGQQGQGFGFGRPSRQAVSAEADSAHRRAVQGFNDAPRNRIDVKGGRDQIQQERDNNDLQYGR